MARRSPLRGGTANSFQKKTTIEACGPLKGGWGTFFGSLKQGGNKVKPVAKGLMKKKKGKSPPGKRRKVKKV